MLDVPPTVTTVRLVSLTRNKTTFRGKIVAGKSKHIKKDIYKANILLKPNESILPGVISQFSKAVLVTPD